MHCWESRVLLAGDGDADQPIDRRELLLADKRKEVGVMNGVWVRGVDSGSAAGSDIKVDDIIIGIDGKYRTSPIAGSHCSIVRVIKLP